MPRCKAVVPIRQTFVPTTQRPRVASAGKNLTRRKRQAIALALGLGSRTVEVYRVIILRKTNVRSTAERVRRLLLRSKQRALLHVSGRESAIGT